MAKQAREQHCIESLKVLKWPYSRFNEKAVRVGMGTLLLTPTYKELAERSTKPMMPIDEMIQVLMEKGLSLNEPLGLDTPFGCFCRKAKEMLKRGAMTEEEGKRILELFFQFGFNPFDRNYEGRVSFWALSDCSVLFKAFLDLSIHYLSPEQLSQLYTLERHEKTHVNFEGSEGRTLLFELIKENHTPEHLESLSCLLHSHYPCKTQRFSGGDALDWASITYYHARNFVAPLLIQYGFNPYERATFESHEGFHPFALMEKMIQGGNFFAKQKELHSAIEYWNVQREKEWLDLIIPGTPGTSKMTRL